MVNCKVVNNGISIALRSLADSGAGGYVFIRRQLAIKLSKRFNIPFEKTSDSMTISGYDGTESKKL
jgi:hypothetical protein